MINPRPLLNRLTLPHLHQESKKTLSDCPARQLLPLLWLLHRICAAVQQRDKLIGHCTLSDISGQSPAIHVRSQALKVSSGILSLMLPLLCRVAPCQNCIHVSLATTHLQQSLDTVYMAVLDG